MTRDQDTTSGMDQNLRKAMRARRMNEANVNQVPKNKPIKKIPGEQNKPPEKQPGGGAGAKQGAGARAKAGTAAGAKPAAAPPPVPPVAQKAKLERRHVVIFLTFLLAVLLPIAVSAWYLWSRAAEQYASYLGFSVRSEAGGATSSELLGGLSSLAGVSDSSTDTDILYKFIQSHDLVERVDRELDLREIWSKPEEDPIFSYTGGESLEDLREEWERKVQIYYDNGIIELRVLAFDPQDAQNITQAIYKESTQLINELNDVAREDALRYARTDLDEALERLKGARQALTAFRNRHQVVDPTADVQTQVGVITSLQQKLAESLVQLGMLQANAQPSDPRIAQTELQVKVIRNQIEAERQKFGSETASGEVLSDVVGDYESLAVDREFAESTYTAALAAFDAARAEASRQSRYLAAFVKPTLAQESKFPERTKLMAIISGFLLVTWIIAILVFYSLRDRR